MFQKKTKTVAEVITAVNSRIEELTKKSASKGQDIEQKKLDISKLLAALALADDDKNQESLKLARKALERMNESFNDLNEQVNLLQGQRSQLERELIEARIRDLPKLIEGEAQQFNLTLEEAIKQGEVMKAIHDKMKIQQEAFRNLGKEYDNLCRTLGVMQPLEIGLGKLAGQGGSFGGSFTVPDQVDTFFAAVVIYESRLKACEDFKIQNPDYQKNLGETQDRDSAPFEFHLLQNPKVFGRNMR